MKVKKTARNSDSDGDEIPFSELKEKVVSERQGSDNDEDDIPFSQIQTRVARPLIGKGLGIKLMNEREADETAKYGEPLRWSDDDDVDEVPITEFLKCLKKTREIPLEESSSVGANVSLDASNQNNDEHEPLQVFHPEKMKGVKIARDFGKQGVYYGEVIRVEYDSEDIEKVIHIPAPRNLHRPITTSHTHIQRRNRCTSLSTVIATARTWTKRNSNTPLISTTIKSQPKKNPMPLIRTRMKAISLHHRSLLSP